MPVTESIETRLRHHLTADMFPPIAPENLPAMIKKCIWAIRCAALGHVDKKTRFPNGETRTVAKLVDDLRLQFFVDEVNTYGNFEGEGGDVEFEDEEDPRF